MFTGTLPSVQRSKKDVSRVTRIVTVLLVHKADEQGGLTVPLSSQSVSPVKSYKKDSQGCAAPQAKRHSRPAASLCLDTHTTVIAGKPKPVVTMPHYASGLPDT